jgi:hypothetical protein
MNNNILNLKQNFTKENLIYNFNKKINEIKMSNISNNDKNILIELYKNEYEKLLKKFTINNMFNTFRNIDQNHTNYVSSSYSYSSNLNPDGNTIVYQHNKTNNNGIVNEQTNRYKIDKNGNKINLLNMCERMDID